MELVTCSYSEYVPEMGIPVQGSIGKAKFFRHSIPVPWKSVMPTYQMLKMRDRDEYRRHYTAKLDAIGVSRMLSELAELQGRWRLANPHAVADESRLVVMCFERLSIPGKWCHRTMFAEWWELNTGQQLREFGSVLTPPTCCPAEDTQLELF